MTSLHDLRAAFYCYGPESVLPFFEDLYSSGWTLLGLFSCLLVTPDGERTVKFAHNCICYLYTYNDKLSPLPGPQRQHQTFLAYSLPFLKGNATKCKHVARVIFDLSRHFNLTAECTVQSLKFVHGLLNIYIICIPLLFMYVLHIHGALAGVHIHVM